MPHLAFTVSVVIPALNAWKFTRACLETLRPTLGVHDEAIVVVRESDEQSLTGLRQFPWAQVVAVADDNDDTARREGALAARGDIVVFLEAGTLLPARWLDGLVSPFLDAEVGATGPLLNTGTGAQRAWLDYPLGSTSAMRRAAKTWMDGHRGETRVATELHTACVAVRRLSIQDFSTLDALCSHLGEAGRKLLICVDSYVHHHGRQGNEYKDEWFVVRQENDRFRTQRQSTPSTPRPGSVLLSACMIMKDEEELLPQCLSSLNGLVDEVVIYDTGSTDRSVELAREAGAKVIEGYWDDDFSRARNAALDECAGDWVFHIDVDEVFEGDPRKVREGLLRTGVAAVQVEIENVSGGKANLVHRPTRIFRRAVHHWQGRLHEQVNRRDGGAPAEYGVLENGRLLHYGYAPEMVAKRNKAERNIRLAQLDADDDNERDLVDKLTNLGRSYSVGGKDEEALAIFNSAAEIETPVPAARRMLCRAGFQSALNLGLYDQALEWASMLIDASEIADTGHYMQGIALTALGRWEDAIEALAGLDDMRDDDGIVFPQYIVHIKRGVCHAALGQWEASADEFSVVATEEQHDEPIWATVVEAYWRTGRDLRALLQQISPKHITAVFAQLLAAPPEAADEALEALFTDSGRVSSVLGLAVYVAPKLSSERGLVWSTRLRSVGMEIHCPLVARAWDEGVEPLERMRAIAFAKAAFDDDRADGAVRSIAAKVATDAFVPALYELSELAPVLLEVFVLGAATDAPRSFAMGRALHTLGADEEGVAVLMHGLDVEGADRSLASQAAEWLESVGHATEAETLRKR